MKKLLTVIFILSALLLNLLYIFPYSHTQNTYAAEEKYQYACILGADTYLYSSADENTGLFIIPKTYYVKVIGEGTEFCHVQYMTDTYLYKAVTGYCKTSDLSFVDFAPECPYLFYTLELTYYFEGYLEDSITGDNFLYEHNVTAAYYGDYKIGSSTYCYILLDGAFGYVPKNMEIIYEENTEYTKVDNEEGSDSVTDTNLSSLRVVLLIILTLFTLALVYFIFRPHTKKQTDYNIDEGNTRF
jgi:hypothetical protein